MAWTTLSAILDFFLPADINVAILYGIAVVLSVHTRSVRLIWATVVIACPLALLGALTDTPLWIIVVNRCFVVAEIILVGGMGHLLLRNLRARAESEQRLSLVQDLMPDPFVILRALRGREGRIEDFAWVYANSAARKGLGITEADLSRSLLDVIPYANQPGGLIECHGRVVETGEPSEFEMFCGTPEQPRWFRNVVVKLGDGVAVTYSDVTATKLARQALLTSEQRLDTALRLRRIAIGNYDADLKYTFIHNSTLGREVGEVIGKDDTAFWEPASAAQVLALLREVRDSGRHVQREMALRPKGADCDYHYDFVVAPLLDGDGRAAGLTCAAANIDAEVAIRSKLKNAVAAKSRFLAAASHDLRQPFQAMRLFLGVLEGQNLEPKSQEAVAQLGKALGAGEELLDALLDVSMFEAGTIVPKPVVFCVADLLRDLVSEMGDLAADRRLSLRLAGDAGMVETDTVLLKRILRNLIHNALRYTTSGGVLVSCRRRGGQVLVQVWDTGPGIPEDKLQAIFEDFYQLANPARDRAKGLGLGLSIVQRMAELLGLRVTVASRVGRGSVFTVTLPELPA